MCVYKYSCIYAYIYIYIDNTNLQTMCSAAEAPVAATGGNDGHVAVCCSVLQCVAVCGSVLQCVAGFGACLYLNLCTYVYIRIHLDTTTTWTVIFRPGSRGYFP